MGAGLEAIGFCLVLRWTFFERLKSGLRSRRDPAPRIVACVA